MIQRRVDAFDPIPPPPPAPSERAWATTPGDPLRDIETAAERMREFHRQGVNLEQLIVSPREYAMFVRVEVGFAWARCHRSWWEAFKAWCRGEP